MPGQRDYAAEYRRYHGTAKQRKRRSMRNKARRMMAKRVGKAAIKGKDIDHKRALSRGGSNGAKNLRIMSKSRNRGFRRNSKGKPIGKA